MVAVSEAHLEKMELKITYLEDSVQELSTTVYQQQKKIEQLQSLCEILVAHVAELAESVRENASARDLRPPHY